MPNRRSVNQRFELLNPRLHPKPMEEMQFHGGLDTPAQPRTTTVPQDTRLPSFQMPARVREQEQALVDACLKERERWESIPKVFFWVPPGGQEQNGHSTNQTSCFRLPPTTPLRTECDPSYGAQRRN